MSKFQPVDPKDVPAEQPRPHFSQEGNLTRPGTTKPPVVQEVKHELEVDYFEVRTREGELVGKMFFPLEFCDRDNCELSFSYHHFSPELRIWVHAACWKPGKSHWDALFHDHVTVEPDVILPWAKEA